MYIQYIYVCKQDLALNNPQELICHETPAYRTNVAAYDRLFFSEYNFFRI